MCLDLLKHQERCTADGFSKLNYINIGTKHSLNGYNTLSQEWLLYLEVLLQQASHD